MKKPDCIVPHLIDEGLNLMLLLSILYFSLVAFSSEARGADEGTEKFMIGSIQTAGNRSISTVRVLSQIRSRLGEFFDPATAAEDAKRIAELPGVEYSYYNTAIVDGKVQVTFVVVERNLVRSVVFIGNRHYKAKTLADKLDFKIADYLDPVSAESGRKALVEFYLKKGFAFVEVSLDGEQLSSGKVIYTINEGPRVRIDSVRLSGNVAVKNQVLGSAVKTKGKRWVFWPKYYTEEGVTEDVAKLEDAYQKRGFLDARITAKRQFNKDKSKVRLTFEIVEGSVYAVESVEFTGNKYFDDKRLMAELKLEQWRVYSEPKANSDVEQLLKLYRENGFIDVRVESHRKFVSKSSVSVEFEITEGERFRIGRVNITGNEQTQDKVVRHVLDEYGFQPGQWYNADVARGDGSGELEKYVRSMAVTEAATITPSGEVSGQRDAQVSITEGQTGMVMLGAGVASDSGIIGQLVFEQRNFDISDWPESFGEFVTGRAFKGAGQDFRIALQPGTQVSEYSVSFSESYFQDKPITLDVTGSSYERDRESYDESRIKGYVGFEKRYKDHWRRSIGFRVENVDVGSLDSDAPKEIRDVKGGNLLAGVRLGIGRDLTDDRYNPSSGYNFNAGYEQVGGDHTFGILSGTHRWYKTIYKDLAERKTVLGTKLLAATVVGDTPPFEKFYAGGSGTYGIRGFDYRGVSTRGGADKDPIGSDWIFLANAEVTVPLVSENFAMLLFADSGTIDSGNYRAAVGTGIQILIPQWFGPVPMRLEVATPIMKNDDDDTQVFSFSVGRLF
jgi:outer membrane protein insertion porin family